MKNTKIVEDVFLETVFIIVDVAVLIYGTLERSKKDSYDWFKKVIASNGEDLD